MQTIINCIPKIINNKSRGFTLVELLIVIAVISVLSAGGIASFLDYSRSQTVNQAANDFAAAVNLAKLSAQSQVTIFNKQDGSKVNCVTYGSRFNGYTINIGSSTYSLNMLCVNNAEPPISNVNFSSGLTISTSVSKIYYGVLAGGAIITGTGASPYSINFIYYGKTKTVKVDASGSINIQ